MMGGAGENPRLNLSGIGKRRAQFINSQTSESHEEEPRVGKAQKPTFFIRTFARIIPCWVVVKVK